MLVGLCLALPALALPRYPPALPWRHRCTAATPALALPRNPSVLPWRHRCTTATPALARNQPCRSTGRPAYESCSRLKQGLTQKAHGRRAHDSLEQGSQTHLPAFSWLCRVCRSLSPLISIPRYVSICHPVVRALSLHKQSRSGHHSSHSCHKILATGTLGNSPGQNVLVAKYRKGGCQSAENLSQQWFKQCKSLSAFLQVSVSEMKQSHNPSKTRLTAWPAVIEGAASTHGR